MFLEWTNCDFWGLTRCRCNCVLFENVFAFPCCRKNYVLFGKKSPTWRPTKWQMPVKCPGRGGMATHGIDWAITWRRRNVTAWILETFLGFTWCGTISVLFANVYSGASERSTILILRSMLAIFHAHSKRNGSQARAPYVPPYVGKSHYMTFLYEAIFA